MATKAKILEIAQRLGVNASTVSRALNPRTSHMIGEKKRNEIIQLCDQLNYRPATAGRSLVTGKTYKIGLILGSMQKDLSSPLFSLFITGLCDQLQKQGYSLIILHANRDNFSKDTFQFLMSKSADGYIVGMNLLDESLKEKLEFLNVPIIVIEYPNHNENFNFPTMRFDFTNSYKEIWKKIPKDFYGKMLFCGPEHPHSTYKFKNIIDTAPEKNIIDCLYYENEKFTFNSAQLDGFYFAKNNFELIMKQKLLWSATDLSTLGIVNYLESKGVKIGEDISIISHDNGSVPKFL